MAICFTILGMITLLSAACTVALYLHVRKREEAQDKRDAKRDAVLTEMRDGFGSLRLALVECGVIQRAAQLPAASPPPANEEGSFPQSEPPPVPLPVQIEQASERRAAETANDDARTGDTLPSFAAPDSGQREIGVDVPLPADDESVAVVEAYAQRLGVSPSEALRSLLHSGFTAEEARLKRERGSGASLPKMDDPIADEEEDEGTTGYDRKKIPSMHPRRPTLLGGLGAQPPEPMVNPELAKLYAETVAKSPPKPALGAGFSDEVFLPREDTPTPTPPKK